MTQGLCAPATIADQGYEGCEKRAGSRVHCAGRRRPSVTTTPDRFARCLPAPYRESPRGEKTGEALARLFRSIGTTVSLIPNLKESFSSTVVSLL